jgi:ParB-like chromosome segregation protein Spo0J
MARNTPKPAASAAAAVGKGGAKPPRAGIGDIMAGVSLNPSPGTATDGAERGRDAQDARAPRHPIGSGVAFERVENIYRMDPRKVVLEGPYIRQFIEDADFHRLRASVALERDIGQHIGVRVVGPPTNQRRVLVYGMRRWRAALAVGLDKVPVRDYGPIGEEKAVELQMLENEIRADPHPVDTAIGFYLLAQQPEWTQKRIGDVFDKNKGYVSEMVRVGEAIARLREVDRQPLYTCPRVTVRAFQSVAQVKSVEARKEALLALLDEPTGAASAGAAGPMPAAESDDATRGASPRLTVEDQASRRRLVDEAVFHVRPLRNGRAFRVRWTDDDLRRDGTRIAEEFRTRFLEEYQHLLHRTAVLHGQASGRGSALPPRIAELVANAAQETARVDARIGGAAPGPSSEDGA